MGVDPERPAHPGRCCQHAGATGQLTTAGKGGSDTCSISAAIVPVVGLLFILSQERRGGGGPELSPQLACDETFAYKS